MNVIAPECYSVTLCNVGREGECSGVFGYVYRRTLCDDFKNTRAWIWTFPLLETFDSDCLD